MFDLRLCVLTTARKCYVMSALAQMVSKLNEVSDRLDRVKGAIAQCSDASTEQRKGKQVEFIDQLTSQCLANPRNVGQASSSAPTM